MYGSYFASLVVFTAVSIATSGLNCYSCTVKLANQVQLSLPLLVR